MPFMVQIIIMLVFGGVACAIASSKGRNAVGWFFGGFFLGLIGVIIVACLSNLTAERAYRQQTESERRRLREQLRQERLKSDAYRRHSADRLDTHDQILGVDTRSGAALPGGAQRAQLPGGRGGSAEDALRQLAGDPMEPVEAAGPPGSAEAALHQMGGQPPRPAGGAELVGAPWYYESAGQAVGPVSALRIREMLRTRALGGDSLLWTEGLADWSFAKDVDIFRAAVNS